MAVLTFAPQIRLTVKKNIGRSQVAGGIPVSQRYAGTQRQIDLTSYLGEGSSVVVRKSVREPAGTFSVTIPDQPAQAQPESLYGLIEPMDVVEISMARNGSDYRGTELPIMMRGFVNAITRDEGIGDDSRPRRSVIISGQDYGCILQLDQIIYLPYGVTGQHLLTYFQRFENYGGSAKIDQDASDFVREVMTTTVTPFIAGMQAAVGGGSSPVMDFAVEATVQSGIIAPFGNQQWPGGTIYRLLTYYGDVGPWNELFVEDRPAGPTLVYRPNPFKDAGGAYIQDPYKSDPSVAPPTVQVSDEELKSLRVERGHAQVYNYYWVDSPDYALVEGPNLQIAEAQSDPSTIFIRDYPNSNPALYGFRALEVPSQQGPRYDGKSQAAVIAGNADAVSYVDERRRLLILQNRDNVVFESGTMHFRGNERVRAGQYIQLNRGTDDGSGGNFQQEMYAHTVQHDFVYFRDYTTRVEFDRGTGFIARVQGPKGIGAPYWSELSLRGLYGA
jgi:hypothetical protein